MLINEWVKQIKEWVQNLFSLTKEEDKVEYPILTIEYFKRGNIQLLVRDTIGSVATIRIRHQESLKKDFIIAVDNIQEVRKYLSNKNSFKKQGCLEQQIKNDNILYSKSLSHRFLFAWIPLGLSPSNTNLEVISIIDGDFIDKRFSQYGITGENKVAFEIAFAISKEIANLNSLNHIFWTDRIDKYDFLDVLNERLTHRFKSTKRLKQYRSLPTPLSA